RLDLPCGRYYLTRINASNPVTIVAHGHTALFIGGDIGTSSPLTITVDPTGTLDLFFAGTLSASDAPSIGSPTYPALTRIYMRSTRGFNISSSGTLAANFYVPNGPVTASSALEVYGSVFAGNFTASSSVRIHYDRAILRAGEECGMPAPTPDAGVP